MAKETSLAFGRIDLHYQQMLPAKITHNCYQLTRRPLLFVLKSNQLKKKKTWKIKQKYVKIGKWQVLVLSEQSVVLPMENMNFRKKCSEINILRPASVLITSRMGIALMVIDVNTYTKMSFLPNTNFLFIHYIIKSNSLYTELTIWSTINLKFKIFKIMISLITFNLKISFELILFRHKKINVLY